MKSAQENNNIQPNNNPFFIGHEKNVNILKNAILKEKFPPSILFFGNKGLGKATLAYRLARYILATYDKSHNIEEEQDNFFISQINPIFTKVANNSHADLYVLKAEDKKNITVDNVRKALNFIHMSALETKYKILIIDSIDDMNVNAANAILKVLEEPPKNSFLILISHNIGKILPTISSRCLKLKFNNLQEEQLDKVLNITLANIDNNLDQQNLVRLANGSAGIAKQLYDLKALDIYNLIFEILNKQSLENIYELVDFICKKDDTNNIWQISCYIISTVMHIIIKHMALKTDFVQINGIENQVIQKFIQYSCVENIIDLWYKFEEDLNNVDKINLDKKSILINHFNKIITQIQK